MITKQCTKCKEPKDLEKDFGNFARGAGGKKSICKDCIALMNRDRYEKKKDDILEKNRDWNDQNKELIKEYKSKHYHKNKEK